MRQAFDDRHQGFVTRGFSCRRNHLILFDPPSPPPSSSWHLFCYLLIPSRKRKGGPMKKARLQSCRKKAVLWPRAVSAPRVAKRAIGLCSSCASYEFCTFPRSLGQPVLECDEFSPACSPKGSHPSTIKKNLVKKPTKPRLRGLCRICDERASCRYPKPEGGVWHCEDYR